MFNSLHTVSKWSRPSVLGWINRDSGANAVLRTTPRQVQILDLQPSQIAFSSRSLERNARRSLERWCSLGNRG
jgi:hypothetical protein